MRAAQGQSHPFHKSHWQTWEMLPFAADLVWLYFVWLTWLVLL